MTRLAWLSLLHHAEQVSTRELLPNAAPPQMARLIERANCEWRLFGHTTKLPGGFCGVRFSGLFVACWKVLCWKLCMCLCEMGLHDA